VRARWAAALVVLLGAAVPPLAWRDVRDAPSNLYRIDDRVWLGGQPSHDDLALLCGAGVRTVVDLRRPVEHDVGAERLAVQGLGMAFVSIPVSPDAPEESSADAFLAAVSSPSAYPVLVHCASGNRAAGFWMIRRLVVDGWTAEAAESEARSAGLRGAAIRGFAVEYAHRRLAATGREHREEP
jgi:uncharacterized protein (TIGR01244 family)